MANYTPPDYDTLLPGEPWTSAKAIAAFENLEAFAEQATDAPKMAMKSSIADVAAPGSLTISSLSDYSGIYIRGHIAAANASGSTANFTLELSTDSGATYLTAQTIATATDPIQIDTWFFLFVDFLSGDWRCLRNISGASSLASGNFASVADNVTNVKLTSDRTGRLGVFIEPRGGDAAS